MLEPRINILVLLLYVAPIEVVAVDAAAIWDNKCEECHGDPAHFSGKYLWNIEGQLQGQHHIEDLQRYLRHHYVPGYASEAIRDMLLAAANSPLRFEAECGSCHGDVAEFVEQSIWVRGKRVTALETGQDVRDFLPTHRELKPEDVSFYLKLFSRVAGKPFIEEEPLKEAITR